MNSFKLITAFFQNLSCWPVYLFIDGDRWNIPFLKQDFHPLDVDIICSILLSGEPCDDELVWHFDTSGAYKVKLGYKLALSLLDECSSSRASVAFVWWRKLWRLKIPTKVICLWRAFLDTLPTCEALAKKQVRY